MVHHERKIMPVKHFISFEGLLKKYDEHLEGDDPFLATTAERILYAQSEYPELRDGFSDFTLLETYKEVI